MHPKLTNGGMAGVPAEMKQNIGHTVKLPSGISEDDLVKLTVEEIEQLVAQAGPVVGYAVMFKLASGTSGVKCTTQLKAAEFLISRGDALEDKKKKRDSEALSGIKALSNAQLDALIPLLEKQVAAQPVQDIEESEESMV